MQEAEKTFETEVLTRLAVIESKLDGYKEIKDTAYKAYNNSKQNEKDIREIQDNNKFLKKTIISQIISLIFLAITVFLNLK